MSQRRVVVFLVEHVERCKLVRSVPMTGSFFFGLAKVILCGRLDETRPIRGLGLHRGRASGRIVLTANGTSSKSGGEKGKPEQGPDDTS